MPMLMLALALMVQDAPLPPVTPGLCKATADKLEPILNSVRDSLNEEARKLREGGTSEYTPERVRRMLELLEGDAVNIDKVQRRYAKATATADELAALDKLHSPDWAKYVKACAA